ncbi:MAG: hypothetical protein IKF49_08255 [Clostridia bacterium]|nr:hypothetical protein [Clostridia bacterium]
MKSYLKKAWILFLALMLLLPAGCRAADPSVSMERTETAVRFRLGDVSAEVDAATGFLTCVQTNNDELRFARTFIDLGIDGKSLLNQLGYINMGSLATYELPTLYPRMKDLPPADTVVVDPAEDGFLVSLTYGSLTILYRYGILKNALSLNVTLSVSDEERHLINGVGFVVAGIEGFSLADATFEFPGSTPAGRLAYRTRMRYRAESADYSAPVVQLRDGDRKTSNVLFVDEVEKWTTASWSDENQCPCVGFLAACEGYLDQSSPMDVGTLYLPLRTPAQDSYDAVSEFWTQLGYHVPDDTSAEEGIVAIYSAHPYGTMDTGYWNKLTLAQYANELDQLAGMGFDAVWLLPVFQHTGDNVYEPIDQAVIDPRYGGMDEAKVFIETAHAKGMKVLFDFVPHGPRPIYPFAKEHDNWISKDQDHKNRIEWECVSMDYNNPGYHAYNVELAKMYAETIGLDGARIDCSMGGLPNWDSSETGLRASAAGLKAGKNVVSAYREGFKAGGADVLLLPENFHPSPAYAEVTDVFYDMALYRTLFDLNHRGLDAAAYCEALSHYLEAEGRTSVKGQLKLRFLGNHDTVTWTFDAARAQVIYGTEKAKAMWMALGWIDGVIFVYQGDENPSAYGLQGENLESFFKELIAAKRNYVPNSLSTEYLYSGTGIFAVRRFDENTNRLVLVNLSDQAETYPITGTPLASIGKITQNETGTELAPYAGVILDVS